MTGFAFAKQAEIIRADGPSDICDLVLAKAQEAFREHELEKDIATAIKRSLEDEDSVTWHIVVGRSFGASCTHACKFLYFLKVGSHYILAFKSAD